MFAITGIVRSSPAEGGALLRPGERELELHKCLEVQVSWLLPLEDIALQVRGEESEEQKATLVRRDRCRAERDLAAFAAKYGMGPAQGRDQGGIRPRRTVCRRFDLAPMQPASLTVPYGQSMAGKLPTNFARADGSSTGTFLVSTKLT